MTDLDAKITEALASAIGKAILGKTATQGAVDAAAAVLALMKPKPLVWSETGRARNGVGCYTNGTQYTVVKIHGQWQMITYRMDSEGQGELRRYCAVKNSKKATKSAAQDHAYATWLATRPIADMIGVKP